MIFADKVVQLRKKSGWSQEELAEKLNVTRQSVSKWEGAQSIPDLEKILQLAQIFGVSTDYLLKDELAEAEYTKSDDSSSVRRVSMEEANAFLQVKQATAGRIAFATFLCILSPICLFLLAAASETGMLPIRENLAGGAGMIVMLLLVAVAVAMFISCGGMTSPYAYLEAEVFETEYGVSGMVRERQRQYRSTYTRYNVLGACLCILSPFLCSAARSSRKTGFRGMLSVMLLLIGLGVIFFIVGGVNWASMEKLLQEGDYTRTKKKTSSITGVVSTVYWCVAAAVYLACSLPGHSWRESWVIWPVAGVLFAAVMAVCSALAGRKK
ncbi:MAG: helix-turn-helix domain-containing protein [Ruthenibacterium lactatiformans]